MPLILTDYTTIARATAHYYAARCRHAWLRNILRAVATPRLLSSAERAVACARDNITTCQRVMLCYAVDAYHAAAPRGALIRFDA